MTQSERIFLAHLRALWPVLDPLPSAVLAISGRGRVLFANRSARKLVGPEPERRPLEEALAAGGITREPSGALQAGDLGFDRAIGGEMVEAEEIRVSVRGVPAFFRINSAPIQGPDGRAIGVLILLSDVTELVAGERRARLLALMGAGLIPIVEPSAIARHVVELTGRGLGAHCALWLATDDDPPQLDNVCYGADRPPLHNAAVRAAARGTTVFDGETLAAPILREDRLLGAIALERSGVADAVMLEQIATQTALALENARLLAETRAAAAAKDAVLAVASHEIATPVAALTGYAEIIQQLAVQEDLNRPALDRATRGITRTAVRVLDLSRRLLDSERIQNGNLPIERRRADLLPTLRMVVERAGIGSARSIPLDARAGELPGRWDLIRMAEAFENLLSNALRYSQPETPVRVAVDVRAGEVHVAVEDAGIGIPETDRATLFEAFRRGSNAHFGGPGLGLGLHLVHEIVRAHDGRVHFESELGRGTTFFVTLPLEH